MGNQAQWLDFIHYPLGVPDPGLLQRDLPEGSIPLELKTHSSCVPSGSWCPTGDLLLLHLIIE